MREVMSAAGKRFVCPKCGLSYKQTAEAKACCEPAANLNHSQVGGDHYTAMPIQPWNIVDTWPLAERIAFYRGNALKYLMRLNDKDTPATNARKAEHYCAKLATVIEGGK